jgi:DNA-binding Lrp family transcriptional regulator
MSMSDKAQSFLLDLEVSKDLKAAVELQQDIRFSIDVIVRQLRNEGETWREIGERLGISRQAAHERFHHVDSRDFSLIG